MSFKVPQQTYSGIIQEVSIGVEDAACTVGGENAYAFHLFEGSMPNPPRIAMEIWDYDPSDEWPEAAIAPFRDVISSPEKWAKKCIEKYGADLIVVQLLSTDPNGRNRDAGEAARIFKKVVDAVNVPVIAWGTANNQKDEETLKQIARLCEGKNVALAPVEEANHKGIGAAALGYNHAIVSSSPIDVNLAKQLSILLGNLGVEPSNTLIDPTTGGLGYGMEYSYSVMERIRSAALTQEDEKLQLPMINNIGYEVWKCKEASLGLKDAPTLGDPEKRAVLMEACAAVCYLMAGTDVLVLRHPETVRIVKAFIHIMMNGGLAADIEGISKNLEREDVDLTALSPEPETSIEETTPPSKKDTPPVKEEVAREAAPAREVKPAPERKAVPEVEQEKPKPEERVGKPAKIDAVGKPDQEDRTGKQHYEQAQPYKKPQEAKEEPTEVHEDDKIKTDKSLEKTFKHDEKAREKEIKQEKRKERKEKEREELLELRRKRSEERKIAAAGHGVMAGGETRKTAAREQPDLVDKLMRNIDRIHRRVT